MNIMSSTDNAPPSVSTANNDTSTADDNAAVLPAASSVAAAASGDGMTIDQHLALTIQTLDQLTSIFNFSHRLSRAAIEQCGPEDVTLCYNWILDNHDVEDGGGPVVPKLDCPHLDRHVKIPNLVLNGNLMTSECQHRSTLRKRSSRKRLRSEDNAIGRLKCEEDYETNGNEEGACVEASSSKCPEGENWLCLECGALSCSRYANGHAKVHYEDTREEAIAMNTADGDRSNSNALADPEEGGGVGAEEAAGHCVALSLADLSVWCYECNAYLQHPSLDALTKRLEKIKFGNDADNDNESNKNDENVRENETGGIGENNVGGFDNDVDNENESNKNDENIRENEIEGIGENNVGGALQGGAETNVNGVAGYLKTSENQANTYGNSGERSSGNKPFASKRKSHPRKLPPELVGTAMPSSPHERSQEESDADAENSNDDGEDESLLLSCSSSSDEDDCEQAAHIASLLNGEHGDAIRAYLAQHESLDAPDFGRFAPANMPKPPSFPDEMADFLRSPDCKSVIVLAGAGMSVSSGIPDFRSAGVGLYDTLRPELLTATELERALIKDDPTLALDKGMFLQNPLPMLETKRSFVLGTYEKRWKATLAHRFVELLHAKLGKLTRLYTQNIDGLELQCTGLPREKVVNVHGSMGAAACEQCGRGVDFDEFCEGVRSNIKDITGQDEEAPEDSTPIRCEACGNPAVKPTIVLFRGSMPKEFHTRTAQDLPECDLLIVMGTSLTVAPANSLVYRIPPTALRMVMNNEPVGRRLGIDYGENAVRDVYASGHSDETCLLLAEKMGWLDDLALIVDELPDNSARLLRERLARRRQE